MVHIHAVHSSVCAVHNNQQRSVYRIGCWTTFWLCSSSFLTIDTDLLQVVYEHWYKLRDQKKILTSSIDSSLPTCLHCVVIKSKSNNVFKSSFSIDVSSFWIAVELCLKACIEDVRELRSFMSMRDFFIFGISFFVKIWTDKYACKVWLVYVVTIVHILFEAVFITCVEVWFFFICVKYERDLWAGQHVAIVCAKDLPSSCINTVDQTGQNL